MMRTDAGTSGLTTDGTTLYVADSEISAIRKLPLGESDHPDSPHFDDQAEKLDQARGGNVEPPALTEGQRRATHEV